MTRYGKTACATALILLAFAIGCGGSKDKGKDETTPAKAQRPKDPFGENVDLRGDQGSASAEKEEAIDPNDLRVPGAEFGTSGKKENAAPDKPCPKGKKGDKCREGQKKKIPFSEGIADVMAGMPWGIQYKTIMSQLEKKIEERYAEDLKNAGGAVEEDRIRSQMLRDKAKLDRSYTKFEGQNTGYEQNFVSEEFTHNNGESMLEYDAGKYVEYLFFFNGRFWKRVWAFRKDKLDNLSFEEYYNTLINRFGEGRKTANDSNVLVSIDWQNDDTYLSSMDKSGFYGVYVLVFTAKVTKDNLDKLRTFKKEEKQSETSKMIETVTSGELSDKDSSVIDSYTGEQTGSAKGIDANDSVMKDKVKKKAAPKAEEEKAAADKKGDEEKKDEKKEEKKEVTKGDLDDIF